MMQNDNPMRIDEQWRSAMPAQWNMGKHSAERKMFEVIIIDADEVIQAIADSTLFEPVVPFKRGLKIWGYDQDRGVAVATDRRVLFLKHKTVGGNIAIELPYKSLTTVADTGGGNLTEGVHIVRENDDAWAIARVSPESAQVRFSNAVRDRASQQGNRGFPSVK